MFSSSHPSGKGCRPSTVSAKVGLRLRLYEVLDNRSAKHQVGFFAIPKHVGPDAAIVFGRLSHFVQPFDKPDLSLPMFDRAVEIPFEFSQYRKSFLADDGIDELYLQQPTPIVMGCL
jgi:hypothetical protein